MSDIKCAGTRVAPPNRRRSESRKIRWCPPSRPDAPETKLFITIGYAEDGLRPIEIFYDSGYRSGSDLETLVSDICIVLSVFLQHEDVQIDALTRSLARETDIRTGRVGFDSLIGVLLEELKRPPQWAAALGGTS